MKKLWRNNHANVPMVGAVVAIMVALIIAVLLYYNIAGAIDNTATDLRIAENVFNDEAGGNDDHRNNTTFAANATGMVNDQMATFFTIAPIVGIVVVAVVVLGYISKIGG